MRLLAWGECHHQMWGVPYRLSGFWMFGTSTSKQKRANSHSGMIWFATWSSKPRCASSFWQQMRITILYYKTFEGHPRSSWLHLLGEPFLTHKPHFFEPLFLNPRSFFLTPPPSLEAFGGLSGRLWRAGSALVPWLGWSFHGGFMETWGPNPQLGFLHDLTSNQHRLFHCIQWQRCVFPTKTKNTLPGWRVLNPKLKFIPKISKMILSFLGTIFSGAMLVSTRYPHVYQVMLMPSWWPSHIQMIYQYPNVYPKTIIPSPSHYSPGNEHIPPEPGVKENHLQKCVGRGYISCQEGNKSGWINQKFPAPFFRRFHLWIGHTKWSSFLPRKIWRHFWRFQVQVGWD